MASGKASFVSIAFVVLSIAIIGESVALVRTFAASYGIDSPGCGGLAAPCRTITGALDSTDPGGEIVLLDTGGYGASITITKSVTIVAAYNSYAMIPPAAATDGITINANGAVVYLRNLTVKGYGGVHGIRINAARQVYIENCTISDMIRSGIVSSARNVELFIKDTQVRNNGESGIRIESGSVTIDRVRSEKNGGSGFFVLDSTAVIRNSIAANNGNRGIAVESALNNVTARASIEDTVMTGNGFGLSAVAAFGTTNIHMARSTVSGSNSHGVWLYASGAVNFTAADSRITDNGEFGIYASTSRVNAVAMNSTISVNEVGAVAEQGAYLSLTGNTISHNRTFGVHAINTRVDASNNTVSFNQWGLQVSGASGVLSASGNLVNRNTQGGMRATDPTFFPVLIISDNTITNNQSYGVRQENNAIVRTRQNNTIDSNIFNVWGTLTSISPL